MKKMLTAFTIFSVMIVQAQAADGSGKAFEDMIQDINKKMEKIQKKLEKVRENAEEIKTLERKIKEENEQN